MSRSEIKISKYIDSSKSRNTVWICYRCNLTFHDGYVAFLHDEVSKHFARKVESSSTEQRVIINEN